MMHKFFILILCTYFLYQNDEVTITWSEDFTLQWLDFKGKPKQKGDEVATTASGILFGFSTTKISDGLVDYSFEISSYFYPEQSWYLKDHVDNLVLAHERLHFDITELYARKFRQRISNTRFTNAINREMMRINNAINLELRDMQNKYDAETNHSQNVEQQKEWQAFIYTELNKLSHYGS
ncbi:MAG: DUF922 domain-containing protein [Bacteroidetes bacterium]|nr:DUF922 domain-containing protein [Bacteroidota bacterium]